MEEFVNLIKEFFNSVFNWNVFCGIACAVFVFTLEIVYIIKKGKSNKAVEKAKKIGHVVTAKRTKAWDDDIAGYSVDSLCHATYVYSVDGREYKYKYLDRSTPPLFLSLYYINNPAKAFSDNKKRHNLLAVLIYIIPIAVAIIVINLLGGV